MDIVISYITSDHPKYKPVWALRDKVLRVPLGMTLELSNLERDKTNTIFIAERGSEVVGCVLMEPHGNAMQLRAMAVDDSLQGKGIGRLLVEAAEAYTWQQGYEKITLHARKAALGFYKNLGYSAYGDEFTEVTIPHYMMEKVRP